MYRQCASELHKHGRKLTAASTLVAEIRYNKPLSQLSLLDRDESCKTVKDYHTLIKILPEMDHFNAGLQMLGVLDMLRKYPEIMQPLFIQAGPMKKLDKGKGVWCCRLFERCITNSVQWFS